MYRNGFLSENIQNATGCSWVSIPRFMLIKSKIKLTMRERITIKEMGSWEHKVRAILQTAPKRFGIPAEFEHGRHPYWLLVTLR